MVPPEAPFSHAVQLAPPIPRQGRVAPRADPGDLDHRRHREGVSLLLQRRGGLDFGLPMSDLGHVCPRGGFGAACFWAARVARASVSSG